MRTIISSFRVLLFCLITVNVAVAFSPLHLTQQPPRTTTSTTTNRINESATKSQITSPTQLSVASEVVANGVAAKIKKSRQVSGIDCGILFSFVDQHSTSSVSFLSTKFLATLTRSVKGATGTCRWLIDSSCAGRSTRKTSRPGIRLEQSIRRNCGW